MSRYHVSWTKGRAVGAIGVMEPGGVVVEAEDADTALLEVYKYYDHIHQPLVVKLQETNDEQQTTVHPDPSGEGSHVNHPRDARS